MNTKYVSVADTAKLVRAALKESFPGVPFSVRSHKYAGGASIRVEYTDGPTAADVEQVAGAFEGSYFDGSIDYQGSNYHSLDGQEVSFGADFIFVNRKVTEKLLEQVVAKVVNKYGFANEIIIKTTPWGAYIDYVGDDDESAARGFNRQDVERLLRLGIADTSVTVSHESATLKRVRSLGDDGYGQGTTGRAA